LIIISFLTNYLCVGDSLSQKSATMVQKERETVTLQCTYSTTQSAYGLLWYRDDQDKQPEFIVRRDTWNDSHVTGTGFGNRFYAKLHKSISTTSLSITDLLLVVSDSAVYYCALQVHSDGNQSETRTKTNKV
uniref:Ig-like domain-containing protein n=1 Tax=Callorhinchus milii TaxID=7868 RepID=A0A4W3IXC2_CALMI